MSRCIRNTVAMILTALAVGLGSAAGGEDTIKIGYTDPLSGPFALVGQQLLQQAQYAVDYINAKGGALGRKFELVAYDNKSQPSEELIALKSITDQRMPFVFQTAGSNVAAALIDAVEKHNARNPDNRVLYINNGARATDLTNEKCSFWHFRFDVNTQQLALMMVRGLPPDIKQVYLLNQDYLFGQSMQRDIRQFLGQFRADIQLVGDELIPLGKIKDFSPYVTKINASGAQALVTGNWGPDLTSVDQSRYGCRASRQMAHDDCEYRRHAYSDRTKRGRPCPNDAGVQRKRGRRAGRSGAEGVGRAIPRHARF